MKQKLLLLVALLCSAFSPLSSSAATVPPVGERLPIPADGKSAVYFAHLYNKNKGYLYETTSGTLAYKTTVPNKKWRIDYNAENQTVILSLGEKSIYMYYDSNYNPLNIFSNREDAVNYGGTGTQGSRELRVAYTTKDASNGYDYIIYLWNQSSETGLLLQQNIESYIPGPFMTTRQEMGTILTDHGSYVPGDAYSRWRFVNIEGGTDQANLTVSGKAQYGTFVAPFDVTLPDGITAYQVEDYDETAYLINLNPVAGAQTTTATLPANTPVIVENLTGETITKDYWGNPTGKENENADRFLTGSYTLQNAPTGSYLLQYRPKAGTADEYETIFLLVSEEEPLQCGQNRCWLTLGDAEIEPAGVKSFKLSGTATGIVDIPVLDKKDGNILSDSAIYDLSGRRLSEKPARGLYIQNGKKILVK